MKYLIYAVLLVGFFTAQAENNATERKVFNPMEEKTRVCQQFEEIKKKGSCEGADCPPLYEGDVVKFLPLQWGTAYACSFGCVVGERMCDETLHPDYRGGWVEGRKMRDCRYLSDEDIEVNREEVSVDAKGNKHIVETKTYKETGCKEVEEYVEVCNSGDGGPCQKIFKYSQEWYEYERELQLIAYEASCFVPTAEACQNIEQEMQQCVVDMANLLSEKLCAPSTSNLWKYRKYGPQEVFIIEEGYNFMPDIDFGSR